jgi:UDP:flavonoid glycosyltransferase YjiC (YdhE family)
MVVSGLGQDKATTNSIVQWAGVGINLEVRQPGTEKLGAAVSKILQDPSYKSKAKELSKEYDKYDVGQVFDGLIQDIVRGWKKGDPPTRQ